MIDVYNSLIHLLKYMIYLGRPELCILQCISAILFPLYVAYFPQLGYTGYEKTLAIGISDSYKLACDPSSTDKTSPQAATSTAPSYISGGYNGCLGFTTITCAHDPYSKAANGDVGTGSIRRLRSTNDNRPAPRVLVEEQEED